MIEVLKVEKWDGGERHNFAFFLNANKNTESAIKKAIPHSQVIRQNIFVFDDLDEANSNSYSEARKRALAKLTPYEREILKLGNT